MVVIKKIKRWNYERRWS